MEEVAPYIRRLKMPPFGPAVWEVSNVYFVGEGELFLIDAGYPTPESIDSILSAWHHLGRPRIKAVLLTHAHLDHIGALEAIKKETGAPAWAHHLEAEFFIEMLPQERIDKIIDEGDEIEAGKIKLTVLHMPGHTSGHLCFLDESSGSLFTGDLVVGSSFAIIVPPSGDMSKYMESLHRIEKMSLSRILPGHGPPIGNPKAKIEEYIIHRILREMQILKHLENGPKSIHEMAEDIYADMHTVLRKAGRMQVLAHLLKMEVEGQVEVVSGEGTDATYRSLVGKLPF
jgi:glyoxylase-like metal-dependent hydrolase (beta-lactamase superfamily II)